MQLTVLKSSILNLISIPSCHTPSRSLHMLSIYFPSCVPMTPSDVPLHTSSSSPISTGPSSPFCMRAMYIYLQTGSTAVDLALIRGEENIVMALLDAAQPS